MGRPKKVVIEKTLQEKFDERFNNRASLRAYMDTLVERNVHADGLQFANFLKQNVFKHENTISEVTVRREDAYVYLTIDKGVTFARKRQLVEKAMKYGFFLTCHNDVEGWLFVPTDCYVAGVRAVFGTDRANRKANGATIIRGKRTRNKK
jgi:hypothetical protein